MRLIPRRRAAPLSQTPLAPVGLAQAGLRLHVATAFAVAALLTAGVSAATAGESGERETGSTVSSRVTPGPTARTVPFFSDVFTDDGQQFG